MMNAAHRRAQLNREAILSASPARLLTMLYDRLILDLHRAEAAQLAEQWPVASENLLHAQDIVAELSGSLRPDVWSGAEGLQALYTYVATALASANVNRDAARTREAIVLVEPLRTAWHEAAGAAAQAAAAAEPARASGVLGVG
jgi:flagellar protein FliS